jgi:CubicO group peptidase (beta-lactamase class C family)
MIDPWESMHDRSAADLQVAWDRLRPQGFRMVSACVYGARQSPLYAALFVQRPGPDFVATSGVDTAGLQAFFDRYTALGYSTTILSATGPANDPVFLCVMELANAPALTRFGLRNGPVADPDTVEHWLDQAEKNNWIPRCISTYGTPGDVRYVLVADANTERLLWAVAGPEGQDAYQGRFDAHTQHYARPVFVSVGPMGYTSLFREDDIGPWEAHLDRDGAGYQATLARRVGEGMVPVMLQAGAHDGANRFLSVFARENRPQGRTLTVNGPLVPALAAVDTAITTYLRDTGTRAASVAITRDDRLVYARAFTWAEPSYPVTTPASVFRIASMSKPITALAIFRLIETGAFGLDDAVIPQLGLSPPPGQALHAAAATITVRQLLAHTSGLGDLPDPHGVVKAFGAVLPSTERQTAGVVLSNEPAFTPGSSKGYSNAAYLVLGLIIEWATGQSYEAAVGQLVFQPLGITRAHLTASRRSEQRPTAVRHHAGGPEEPDLTLALSGIEEWAFRTPSSPYGSGRLLRFGRPLAATTYGGGGDYGVLDAAGSWCLAAADFARVLAAFERKPHPLLTDASIAEMTTSVAVPGIADGLAPYALGWHVTHPSPQETRMGHRGNLGGVKSGGTRSTRGWSYAALQNSDAWNLDGAVGAAVANLGPSDWPTHDLWGPVAGLPGW